MACTYNVRFSAFTRVVTLLQSAAFLLLELASSGGLVAFDILLLLLLDR